MLQIIDVQDEGYGRDFKFAVSEDPFKIKPNCPLDYDMITAGYLRLLSKKLEILIPNHLLNLIKLFYFKDKVESMSNDQSQSGENDEDDDESTNDTERGSDLRFENVEHFTSFNRNNNNNHRWKNKRHNNISFCKWYGTASGCTAGGRCKYSHANPNRIPFCKWIESKHGCKYGWQCRNRHVIFTPGPYNV